MHLPFTIAKPCHEDWNAMQPNEEGRHCLSCTKTVVDFTNWEVDDIKRYLGNQTGEHVCGRFRTQDLQPAQQQDTKTIVREIWVSALPEFKKMAAIICLMFGMFFTSCNSETTGKTEKSQLMGDTISIAITPRPDTANQIMGAMIIPDSMMKHCSTGPKTPKKKRAAQATLAQPDMPYVTMGVPPLPPEPPQLPPVPLPDTVKN